MMTLISFVLVFALSFGLTYWVRQFAVKKNLIDTPNERSSHSVPTPRGGGLAIVLSFYAALVFLYVQGNLETSSFFGLLGLASIAVIGFIDDHDHIPARYRLMIHFAAAAWACYWLGVIPLYVTEISWLSIMLWGISLFYLVWLLNLYNFMDGIDGIAGVEAITVVASASLLLFLDGKETELYPMMALVAAVLGFLFWNWPPAKIFMGDVGSAFIGILIGGFSLITANNGSLEFSIWLILLAVFISDSTYTLLVRLFQGEKVYEAHRSHAYQYLSRLYGHKFVTAGVLMINLFWLLPLAWLGHYYSHYLILFVALAYMPLIILIMRSRTGFAE